MNNPASRKISLRGVRAFCAAARHSTLRHAAEELFLTPSAVSHQIKNLETELGVTLFDRAGRSLVLTEEGEVFFREASAALMQLESAAANLQASHYRISLLVSVQPFLASELLIPCLQEFSKTNPKIEVNIDASNEAIDSESDAVDVSIRLHRRPPADFQTHLLFPLTLVPACAPDLMDEAKAVITGTHTSVPFIVQGNRPGSWRQWASQCGIRLPETQNVVRFDNMSAIVQAAERGVGIALVPVELTRKLFDENRLVRFFDSPLVTDEYYYIAYRGDNQKLSEIRLFTDWVLQSLGTSGSQDC